jgi:2-aminoadipate transaminase
MREKMQITQASVPEGVIDFGIGQPQVDLLPLDKMNLAWEHQLQMANAEILQYGLQQGDARLRMELAGFLTQTCNSAVDPESLLVTGGISQALDLICTLLTRPGDTIVVEEPSYFLALRIFKDHHLNIVGTPMDENGLIIPALEERVKQYKPKLVYTIPVYHNPAGVTLPAQRREALVRLSTMYDFLVVADEVYQLLSYTDRPPPPMAFFDTAQRVISLGSFSKILAPGLRLGWMHAHKQLLKPFWMCGSLDSGGGSNPFNAAIVSSAIALGLLQENLQHLKATYTARRDVLAGALNEHLPGLTFTPPDGGFFIWAELAGGMDAERILEKASQHDVGFQPGVRFSSLKGLGSFLRLCFAYYRAEDLIEGVARLARAIEK